MTGDLFGHSPPWSRTRPAGQAPNDKSWVPPINRLVHTPGQPQFYQVGSRTLSVEEVYRQSGFRQAERAYPDHDVVIVLDTFRTPAVTYLVTLPRNHPSRLDAHGHPDPAKQPFWGHGGIMHLRRQDRAPP